MLCFFAASSAAQPPPTFAPNFYTGALETGTMDRGTNAYMGDQRICCPMDPAKREGHACDVQTMNLGSDGYEQGSKQRTRVDSAQGAIVTWYGKVMKQMAIAPTDPGKSKHKYACAAYCPINGTFSPSISIGEKSDPPYSFSTPKLRGSALVTQPDSVGGKSAMCQRWAYTQKISVMPVAWCDMYADTKTTPPTPFVSSKLITRLFAGPNSWQNVSFAGYTPSPPGLDDWFDIDPASIQACPKAKECAPSQLEAGGSGEWLSPNMQAMLRFGKLSLLRDDSAAAGGATPSKIRLPTEEEVAAAKAKAEADPPPKA